MSSLQSHFRRHPDRNDAATQDSRSSSRIPTKSCAGDGGKPGKTVQHVSKLAKRPSRSNTTSEPGIKSSTTRTATPVTAVTQNANTSGRRTSVTPSGATQVFPPPNLRTPSLVSGSSLSTYESPRSALRRKPSAAIDKYAAQKRSHMAGRVKGLAATMHSRDPASQDVFEDTVLGITFPPSSVYEHGPTAVAHPYYDSDMMHDFTPPVPSLYAPSATPSTRYTESPFSHVPTPSSASSYSPGIVSTSELGYRPRQGSTPSLTRKPTIVQTPKAEGLRPGLQPVRESSTSSSNSTVCATNKLSKQRPEKQPVQPAASASTKATEVQKLSSRGQQTTISTTRQLRAVPPELAHLDVDVSTSKAPPQKPSQPVRPTRDNTPNIPGMRGASPVIQSDLPKLYTTYHKRTPSQEAPVSPSSSSFKSRFGFSRSSSRNESPRIDSAISPPPASRRSNRGPTPEQPTEVTKLQRKDSPALAEGPGPAKTSRFGIFHRKSKDAKLAEKPKRQSLKGPVAGTGHEGYGRFGVRGRSGSGSSSAGFRSPSTDSGTSSMAPSTRPAPPRGETSAGSKAEPMLDDFLSQRLKPVILRGSGSTFSNAASSMDLPESSLQPASSKSSSLDSYPRPRLLPSAMRQGSQSPTKRGVLGRRRPSDSSEDDVAARYPTLAARRSLTRLSSTGSKSPVRVPSPINTTIAPQQATLHSYDGEPTAWPQTDSSLPFNDDAFHGKEGLWLRSPSGEPTLRPAKKLNFFQRMATPRSKGKERELPRPNMPEHAAHKSPYRAVAHYAMASSVERIGLDEVERIAQENETSAEDSMSEHRLSKVVPYEGRHYSLLPSPPTRSHSEDSDFNSKHVLPRIMVQRQDSTESPELLRARPAFKHQAAQVVDIPKSPKEYHTETMTQQPAHSAKAAVTRGSIDVGRESLSTPEMNGDSPRQPRLSPVGRIPAVVSKRDRDRKLSDISFSRPFARTQPRPSVKPPGSVYSQIREMASPIESSSQPISSASTATSTEHKGSISTDPRSISTTRTSMDLHNIGSEFFNFQDRKNSEQSNLSYSTSSGNPSWMSALYAQAPQQEDVWNEYDDFMEEHMPLKTPTLKTPTTGSSLGAPFQYSSMLFDGHSGPLVTPALYHPPPSGRLPVPPGFSETVPTILTVPQQISRFLQPSMSPLATPDTISGLIGGYGNRSTSTLFTQDRASIPNMSSTQQFQRPNLRDSMASSRHSRGSYHSRTSSLPEGTTRHSQPSMIPGPRPNSDAQLRTIAETPGDRQGASSSLRIGALMTSKWLSFGRVLFSPAHNEIRFAEDPKVLVVDGLSSDWSHYIALSYPDAKVYNMTPIVPGSPSFSWPDEDQAPPSNLHQIPMVNIGTPFPFPKGFFKAVVFRFPTATTEQAYAACISECKRVLQPGGYLECALLDLDLLNMGTKARGAVRGLKTRMQHRDPQVCLRNLSDILIRLIGRRGFDSLQRCIVGVPAAGRIPRSQDLSSVSSDSSSGKSIWPRTRSRELTFSDLLEDAFAPGKNNDETITKMVAKVGRFWYSSCYEKALLPADRSIWSEANLLRECETQGTTFKLLICHAQKPMQTRRRTVSV
ncbi:hypothetical protein CLAFUW4_02183 [Fulvia fulva]|uniref:Methyltransferase type 11 domain-containing protein n=1 Tax=Passalora fulva TaxID=5499 RepID=A0A9Q8P2M3_PASFU|nr:uncharacterized protein CLAFUR5_02175 [Fulvia fulva]KAK4635048.1 hypothetical protein CLAFUR4_02178 [Fulvia fulva]KAK4638599.1 hypothetical protein CLAFUR0_02181 [Fulvia fulva]UJO10817.1 hypothetical protein CLAFUR5_02175 [Fulvia fulva]WPV10286.1 hypothetical protein CLAFUW4_02183 [Fulvia fulva]WPV24659.1 hypothetical protein CLAFUW7_02183 [Fulvia fulva]